MRRLGDSAHACLAAAALANACRRCSAGRSGSAIAPVPRLVVKERDPSQRTGLHPIGVCRAEIVARPSFIHATSYSTKQPFPFGVADSQFPGFVAPFGVALDLSRVRD